MQVARDDLRTLAVRAHPPTPIAVALVARLDVVRLIPERVFGIELARMRDAVVAEPAILEDQPGAARRTGWPVIDVGLRSDHRSLRVALSLNDIHAACCVMRSTLSRSLTSRSTSARRVEIPSPSTARRT